MYIYVEIEDGTSLLEVFALHYRNFSTVYHFFVITCIIVLENVPLAPMWHLYGKQTALYSGVLSHSVMMHRSFQSNTMMLIFNSRFDFLLNMAILELRT